ncbi:MAG: hypothetical protein ACPG4U_03090 [Pseudomonadales bacterium]
MPANLLNQPLTLPCGAVLKNRLFKAAMSDALGDGAGNATQAQAALYEQWARGGIALSIIGEVQVDPKYPERPGNLVLDSSRDLGALRQLTQRATTDNTHIWAQLGHAGALAHKPVSEPAGPSALDLAELKSRALSLTEIAALPGQFAAAAVLARECGFSGVQIHAAHGFLLGQFLSPLFNHRSDRYAGSIEARYRLIGEIITAVRSAVGSDFPIGIKLNSSDLLEGGLQQHEALDVIKLLAKSSVDLIEISGGTYFPGAVASSDSAAHEVYFSEFARKAKTLTQIPIALTGGIKTLHSAQQTITQSADMLGLARALVLSPQLAHHWLNNEAINPRFPRFDTPAAGAVTAWYSMQIAALAEGKHLDIDAASALELYEARDEIRNIRWREAFH